MSRYKIERKVLDNGLVVLLENRPVDLTSICIGIGAGTNNEDKKFNGISHFLEHMPFCGTKKYPKPEQVGPEIESLGGYLNAYTDRTTTRYVTTILPKFCGKGLKVLTEMVQNPLLKTEQVEKERKIIIEEIGRKDDNPLRFSEVLLYQILYKNSIKGLPVLGTIESVKRIKRATLKKYKDDYYVPNNKVICAVGNIQKRKLLDDIQKTFGSLKKRKIKKKVEKIPKSRVYEKIVKKDVKQAQVRLGVKTPGIRNDDIYALSLLNFYLGRGFGSRLFDEIRNKRRLAYSVYSSYRYDDQNGEIIFYAGTKGKNVEKVKKIMINEVRKIKDKKILKSMLDRSKRYLRGSYSMRRERTLDEAMMATYCEIIGDVDLIEKIPNRVDKLTEKEVSYVADKYFNEDKYCWAIIKPKK